MIVENKTSTEIETLPLAWMLECQDMHGGSYNHLSWSRSGAGVCSRLEGEEHEHKLFSESQVNAMHFKYKNEIMELEGQLAVMRERFDAMEKLCNEYKHGQWAYQQSLANACKYLTGNELMK